MDRKELVRISPQLLGRIADTAAEIKQGSLVVQFAGKLVTYNDAREWQITHAVISNSLAMSRPENRALRNEHIDHLMRTQSLTHVGWLRQASKESPLSSLDLETQRVYEAHLGEAFVAILDNSKPRPDGPVVYFYCLANPTATRNEASFNAFTVARHVILDTSVPHKCINVLLTGFSEPPSKLACVEVTNSKPTSSASTRPSNGTRSLGLMSVSRSRSQLSSATEQSAGVLEELSTQRNGHLVERVKSKRTHVPCLGTGGSSMMLCD